MVVVVVVVVMVCLLTATTATHWLGSSGHGSSVQALLSGSCRTRTGGGPPHEFAQRIHFG